MAAVITALTLWLVWLGYGYDLAYLGEFGLSPEQLGHGSSDFLLRSFRPVLAMAEALVKFKEWETQQRLLIELAWASAAMASCASLLLALGAYAYSLRRLGPTGQERYVASCFSAVWSSNPVLAVLQLLSPLKRPVHAVRAAWVDESRRWMLWTRLVALGGGPAIGVAGLVIGYATVTVAVLVFGVVILAISGWPLSATQAGTRSARAEVIEPTKCAKPGGHQGPHCVRIVIRGCESVRGRLIDRNSQRVFIFVKAHGGHVDFPLAGTVVEDVSDESAATHGGGEMTQNCRAQSRDGAAP
jgi:hypothetical protein